MTKRKGGSGAKPPKKASRKNAIAIVTNTAGTLCKYFTRKSKRREESTNEASEIEDETDSDVISISSASEDLKSRLSSQGDRRKAFASHGEVEATGTWENIEEDFPLSAHREALPLTAGRRDKGDDQGRGGGRSTDYATASSSHELSAPDSPINTKGNSATAVSAKVTGLPRKRLKKAGNPLRSSPYFRGEAAVGKLAARKAARPLLSELKTAQQGVGASGLPTASSGDEAGDELEVEVEASPSSAARAVENRATQSEKPVAEAAPAAARRWEKQVARQGFGKAAKSSGSADQRDRRKERKPATGAACGKPEDPRGRLENGEELEWPALPPEWVLRASPPPGTSTTNCHSNCAGAPLLPPSSPPPQRTPAVLEDTPDSVTRRKRLREEYAAQKFPSIKERLDYLEQMKDGDLVALLPKRQSFSPENLALITPQQRRNMIRDALSGGGSQTESFRSRLETKAQRIRETKTKSGDSLSASQKSHSADEDSPNEQRDMRIALWEPPVSPYGLIEEMLYNDPWKLLVACMLLNKTTGKAVRRILWRLFELAPNPATAAEVDVEKVAEIIKPLGLFNKRAIMFRRFSKEYLEKDWTNPQQLFGIGQYAADAYNLFCRNKWRSMAPPEDKDLKLYYDWLKSTGGEGNGYEREVFAAPVSSANPSQDGSAVSLSA